VKYKALEAIRAVVGEAFQGSIETYEGLMSEIIVRPGASVEAISQCNKFFGNRLPEEYQSFLQNFDGATFFKVSDIGGFQFWACDELIRQNNYRRENLGEYCSGNRFRKEELGEYLEQLTYLST